MKVFVVIDSLSLGGAENLVATLAKGGLAAGLDLTVASIGPEGEDALMMLPTLRSVGLDPQAVRLARLADGRAVRRLARAMGDAGSDVVHAHLEYSVTLAPLAARLAGLRAVCTFHHVAGPLSPREALKERIAVAVAKRSGGIVFVSGASRDALAARYRIPPARSTVVRNGVDLSEFHPGAGEWPPELRILAGAPVATLVGALRAQKGQQAAIEAWPRVLERVPEARLLLVGSGVEEHNLRARAAAAGVAGSVVFAGMRRDVAALVRASALVLLPSETEALPTTLIEAAASGQPVVATRVGGAPEVVVDGETGILVPVGDTEALADAISGLLTDTTRRLAMGAAARRVAELRFDMNLWAARLRRVYEAAIAGADLGALDLGYGLGDEAPRPPSSSP